MEKNIIVSPFMHSSAGRRHLAGVYRYVAEHNRNWEITPLKQVKTSERATIAAMIAEGNVDGVITVKIEPDDFIRQFLDADIPVVTLDYRLDRATSCIFSDDESVGRLAAEHLLSFGNFRTFGYVPFADGARWSYLRMKGFAETLAKHNRKAVLKGPKTSISDWMVHLEFPAAIFCASDAIAGEVLVAARLAKIRVPQNISVLGVDDDALFCDNTRPALSSIQPGHEASGYAAAESLDRFLRHKRVSNKLIPPAGITDRDSIVVCLPATALVERAVRLIAEHATDGWGVDEVAKKLHVSRRLLSLRFAQIQGQSVHQALVEQRLKKVERLLKSTHGKIKDISLRSGFGNVNYLKRLFKSRTGVTMKDFRSCASAPADTRRK